MSFIKYIADESHYKEVLSLMAKAKQTVHFFALWLTPHHRLAGKFKCSDPIKNK